jgi:uncharacterized protein YutE (UPF0331/DUF86 family)/predicted nucleotidyltransferase
MSDQDLLANRLGAVLEGPPGNGVVAAWLFGSHAEGRANRDSDVDVGVLLSRDVFPDVRERFEARLRLYSRLQSAVGRAALDVVVLNDVPPGLAARVVTTGLRVYCADDEAEHAFRRDQARGHSPVTPYFVERLTELRTHLDHLAEIRPRVTGVEALRRDLSLRNDVLFSLVTVCQLVIDIAGDLSARRGRRFEDYTEAVRNLSEEPAFSTEVVRELERLPGFRNILVHEYVALDLARVVEALDRAPVERFLETVRERYPLDG